MVPVRLMTQTRLIVVGPVPPPYHGVTVSTSLVPRTRFWTTAST